MISFTFSLPDQNNWSFGRLYSKLKSDYLKIPSIIFSIPPSLCTSSWLSRLEKGSLVHSSLHTQQAYEEDSHFYGANTAIAISVSMEGIYFYLYSHTVCTHSSIINKILIDRKAYIIYY